ncbi:MAG: tetratricopeptide repeat protein [Desulfatiglandales bacterium]
MNLGRLYQKIESCERSLDYYENALNFDSLIEETSFRSIILNNIGELYFRCFENTDSATKYYNASLRISMNSGDESGIVSTRVNLGNVYYENKEFEKALKNYKSVLIYDVARQNKAMYSPILINIGIAYEKLQQPDSAVLYLNKGLALAEELGFMEYQFNAYSSLLAVDSAKNDVISVMRNLRKMLEIKDSIWNSDVAEKIAEIEIQTVTEKKGTGKTTSI